MKEGDMFIMANFRADRVRQILALLTNDSAGYDKPYGLYQTTRIFCHVWIKLLFKTTRRKIDNFIPFRNYQNTAWASLSQHHHKTQLRLAETEKFAHVTYFFNGGRELPYENEDRILIPSPKVKTYDLQA